MLKKDKEKQLKILTGSGLVQGLSYEECKAVFDEIAPVIENYEKNDIIIREGEIEHDLGIIFQGIIRGEKLHMEGDLHLVNIHEKGDLISLDSVMSKTRIAPVTLISTGKSEIITINVESLLSCTYRERIMKNVIEMLAGENIKKLYKIDILSHPGLRDRIMTYMKIMAQKHNGKTFHSMMTQEQMAQYLSVNRSSLSNELNKMRREGLLTFNKDKFTLLV